MGKLLVLVGLVVYGYGVWRFWRGFDRTNFSPNLPNKLILSLLWPALVVVNKSYRQNFTKVLKGR